MESMDTLLHLTSKSQRKSLYSDFCSSIFLQVSLISKWVINRFMPPKTTCFLCVYTSYYVILRVIHPIFTKYHVICTKYYVYECVFSVFQAYTEYFVCIFQKYTLFFVCIRKIHGPKYTVYFWPNITCNTRPKIHGVFLTKYYV